MRTIERPSDTDTTTREMDIYIWYPADPVIGYWVDELNAYWESRVVLGDTARPVVFFSHGGCGHPLSSVYYTSFLPSWGFITIATMHPGSMFGEPDCLDSASLHDTWLNRPGDVDFTRRWFIDLCEDSSSLFGVLDTNRMGISGHSFGARTTYAMLNRYDYFLAGLAFSGNYVDRFDAPMNCMEDIRGVDKPIMIQNGTYDNGLPHDYAEEIYDTLESPKYWVEIHRATHFAWGDTCSSDLDPQCGADSILSYDQGHHEILKYGVPFLMKYVMGDGRFDDYLTDTSDTFVTLTYDVPTKVDEQAPMPDRPTISACPNPFNSAVTIEIADAVVGAIHELPLRVEIYDISGRIVDEITSRDMAVTYPGEDIEKIPKSRSIPRTGFAAVNPLQKINATDKAARNVVVWRPESQIGSGVYIARITVGNLDQAIPVVYIK